MWYYTTLEGGYKTMDPDSTFYAMTHTSTMEEKKAHASDLQSWLDKGGYWPTRYSEQRVRIMLRKILYPTGLELNMKESTRRILASPI